MVRTRAGWLHVATLDLHARRVVGWAMATRQDVALVLTALRMALWQRRPAAGLIRHSGQGGMYAASEYRTLLLQNGVLPSMSGKGNCFDNAVAESFFSTLKNDLTHHRSFTTHEEARAAIFDSLSEAEEENGQSRIYRGIHWSFDKREGIAQGRRVADHVFNHAFLPVH